MIARSLVDCWVFIFTSQNHKITLQPAVVRIQKHYFALCLANTVTVPEEPVIVELLSHHEPLLVEDMETRVEG